MTTRRQKQRNLRKSNRERLLAIRDCKMNAARFAFECARFYHENDNLPGTMFWEREGRLLCESARSV